MCLRRLIVACMLMAVALQGCTVVSEFDIQQCSTDADCDVLGGEVRHCQSGECLPGCSDNAQCAAVDPRSPLCQRRGGDCVSLLDEASGCSVASGYDEAAVSALTLADADVIGGFAASHRSSTWLTLDLAAREVNAAGADAPSPARPLLVVLCDDAPGAVQLGVPHLVQGLGATALVAPTNESSLRAAMEEVVTSAPALLVSPAGSSLDSAAVGELGERLWFLGSAYADVARAFDPFLRRAIAVGSPRANDPSAFHIASVVGVDPEDSALARAVHEQLDIDGLGVADIEARDRLRTIRPSPALSLDSDPELVRLREHRPDLVLVFAGAQENPARLGPADIIRWLEDGTPAGVTAPLYIFGPRSTDDPALRRLVADRAELAARVVGVRADPEPLPSLLEALAARFAARYPEALGNGRLGVLPATHDALYLLAHSLRAARAGAGPAAPLEVAAGFRRVTDTESGVVLELGPGQAGIDQADSILLAGGSLSLMGSSGPLRFDPESHARRGEARLYTITADERLAPVDPMSAFSGVPGGGD